MVKHVFTQQSRTTACKAIPNSVHLVRALRVQRADRLLRVFQRINSPEPVFFPQSELLDDLDVLFGLWLILVRNNDDQRDPRSDSGEELQVSVTSKRHQMKAFSCVVIVSLIVQNVGQHIVLAELQGLHLSRGINDPHDHIPIALKEREAWEVVRKRTSG